MNMQSVLKRNPAYRRYLSRFIPSSALYVAAVALISGWLGWEPSFTGVGALYALLPALPVAGMIWAMGAYLDEETDEFMRVKQVRANMLALGLTLVICTAWGFLSQYAGVWSLPLYLIFPLFCGCFGFTSAYVTWRYR